MPDAALPPLKSRRPWSLAQRATAMAGVATTLILLLFTWTVERSIEGHFASMDLDALRGTVTSIQTALAMANPQDLAQTRACLSEVMSGHGGVVFQVSTASGVPVFGTAPPGLTERSRATPAVSALDVSDLRIWQDAGRVYRGAVLRAPGRRRLLVAMDIDVHVAYLTRLRHDLWLGAVVASLFSILAAWLAVRQGLAPIHRMVARMRGITSEKLDVRLDPGMVPLELSDLVKSFNALLERIEKSFQRLSNFSADIAHELRTPVTNLTTQTQVALSRGRSADDYREILYSNLEEYERMAAMIGDMLFLAQADHGLVRIERAPMDMAAEVRALFEYFEAWAEERAVTLRLEGADVTVAGDRAMLRRALSNLVSNAIRHTAQGQAVTVRLTRTPEHAEIVVENPGAEIPAEHLPHLFDRFYRVDPSRKRAGEGAGLGLAIVKSIVEAHDGSVGVESAHGRTRVWIRLP